MATKTTYKTSKQEYINLYNNNLEIRHNIAKVLPYLIGTDREKYQEFFRFTERLEKRIYWYN